MKCPDCKTREIQKHHNSKRCLPCALERRKHPRHSLTLVQQLIVRSYAGILSQNELAKKAKASRSNVIRFAVEVGISLDANRYPDSVVDEVCKYYEKHGKRKTQKEFPKVSVRSIVERYYQGIPRQTRWKDDELIELARMAGIISKKAQAQYFGRPCANEGSIISAWMKKYGQGGGNVNGLSWHVARHFVGPRCKPIRLKVWARRKKVRNTEGRQLVLWTELKKYLKPSSPLWIKQCIKEMAAYQRWLFGVKDVKSKVSRMIKEREVCRTN